MSTRVKVPTSLRDADSPLGQFCAHPGRGSAHAGPPRDRKRDAGNPFCDLRAKHAHCRFSESVDQAATNGVTGDDQPVVLVVHGLPLVSGC